MKAVTVGFAMCGSYCTFEKAFAALEHMKGLYADIVPIMSGNAAGVDTRFGRAKEHVHRLESICGKEVLTTIPEVEPLGPQGLLDIIVIVPCTGTTLAKIANGISDSSVTMAAKAHLRNGRPLLIALSTNDALSGNAENLGRLLNRKNVFFVPMGQDDPLAKPNSLSADYERIPEAIDCAVRGVPLQPLLL